MKLIIGLGNPGIEYENTRHNIGFMLIDAYANKNGYKISKSKKNAFIYKGKNFILAKPKTYMNLSGTPLVDLINFYKINLENVLVIYDDMDTKVGFASMKPKGSAGGQNGMRDIVHKLGTQEVQRLKVGIGRPKYNAKNYVLNTFSSIQLQKLSVIKDHLLNSIDDFINNDFNYAMNKLNTKTKR